MTFREILQSKMTAPPESESSVSPRESQSTNESESFFVSSVEEIFRLEIPQKLWQNKSSLLNHYPRKARPTTVTKNKTPVTNELLVALSELSVGELMAVELLRRYEPGAFQNDILSLSQLRKLHRRLVRKYHPDMNPKAGNEAIQQIQEAKTLLQSRLQTSAKSAA